VGFEKKIILFVFFCFSKNLLAPDLKLKNCTSVGLSLFIVYNDRRKLFDIGVNQEFILKGVDKESHITIKHGKERVAYTKVCLSRNKYLKIFAAKVVAPDSARNAKECGDWFSTACIDY